MVFSPSLSSHFSISAKKYIKALDVIANIALLPEIMNVLFYSKPIYGKKPKDEMAPHVLKRIPQIETVDGKMVSSLVRKQAQELF
jgi:hypothetical protein